MQAALFNFQCQFLQCMLVYIAKTDIETSKLLDMIATTFAVVRVVGLYIIHKEYKYGLHVLMDYK